MSKIIPITHNIDVVVNAMFGQLHNEMARRLELEAFEAEHQKMMNQIREQVRVKS